MNSRKPLILTRIPRAKARTVDSPRVTPRAAPRIILPPKPDLIGTCLLCGDDFTGPGAIRLRHGCVRQRKWGTEFIELPFDDHDKVKYLCLSCALDNWVVADDLSRLSSRLNGLSADGQCCLCKQVIEPLPHGDMSAALEADWSSAIEISLGEKTLSHRGSYSLFRPKEQGHLHFFCMDDLNIPLWRLAVGDDTPDYREYLPCG